MIAIDLGSNTIRFIEYDGQKWGGSFEKIVKTAESLHQTNEIGENALQRIIYAIYEAKNKLDFAHHDVIAYTTAAMRLASNSEAILREIFSATGILFQIIDSDTEAELTLNAVRYRLKLLTMEPREFILADIGGGSTELIRCSGTNVYARSLNMGIVTLSESASTRDELRIKIKEFKEAITKSVDLSGVLVLTAGTPTTLAAYILGMDYESYDPQKINGYRLHLADCIRVYDELLAMDKRERTRYVGVGRENLIIAGILMVTALYEAMGCSEAIIIDDGLREGIALEYFKES